MWRMVGCGAGLTLLPAAVMAADEVETYRRDVLPVLESFCFDCHGDGESKGGLAFDGYADFAALLGDKAAWRKVDQFVAAHVMPPAKKPQPTPVQRAAVRRWIDARVFHVDSRRQDPGHVTLRRLNREEYNNSVRDVFGIESRPADQFPPDDSGYGFDNIGDVLSLSPLLMEKYLRAAEEVLDEALALRTAARVGVELADEKLTVYGGVPREENGARILRSGEDELGTEIEVPVAGAYQILVRAARGGAARMNVLLDGNPLDASNLREEWKGRRQYWSGSSRLTDLPAGRHRVSVRVANPAGGDLVAVDFLGVTGPFAPVPPVSSPFLREHLGPRALGAASVRLSGEDTEGGEGRNSLDTGKSWFASKGFRRAPLLIRQPGRYHFAFKVGAQQAGEEPVRFEVRSGDRSLGVFEVTAAAQTTQVVEFESVLSKGEHDLQVWFLNEYKDPRSGEERWLWLHEFSVAGPLEGAAREGLRGEEVLPMVVRTAARLLRRPLSQNDRAKMSRLIESVLEAGEVPMTALRYGLKALLISPKFLFHNPPEPVGPAEGGSRAIDEYSLASRLSCFLWSSVPDDALLRLADEGRLRRELAGEVRRMLRDPRAGALTRNFAGQWLQLRDLDHRAPDRSIFPGYDPELAKDLKRESELFFEHILRNNRPVLDFLDADYTFVNDRLARYYGLAAPGGEGDFRQVSLRGTPRRGILTHGSILTLTSHPTRTSPVNRGKWILEQILGTPPPPAPGDVPPLKESTEDASQSVRKRLEEHRGHPACASCHAFLDPMGFALENFDAIGRWRETDEGHDIDASGRLVTGQVFENWSGLQAVLATELKGDFLRSLAEHLLTYALGRGVTWKDKLAVREIVRRTEAAGYGFEEMILAVCESVPFQRMRAED